MGSVDIDKQLHLLTKKVVEVENHIVHDKVGLLGGGSEGVWNSSRVHMEIYNVRKLYLKMELYINKKLLDGSLRESDIKDVIHKMHLMNKNLRFLDRYYNNVMQAKQKQSLDSLTLVTLIFLPLTLITGYFGMNFKAMGSPSVGKGVFNWHKGQHFVFFLFVISIVIIIVLVRLGIIYG